MLHMRMNRPSPCSSELAIVGVRQRTLAVRKFSKCGRPDQVFAYQHLDTESIVEACGRALSETALVMGTKSGAIKALQFRAIQALARALPKDLG